MARWLVTTVVHEFVYVDAETEAEACEKACERSDVDNMEVLRRTAEKL